MSRKIILNLAISLDGWICEDNGGYAWISGHGDIRQNTEKQFDFSVFLGTVDTIVMGRKAFDDCGVLDIEENEKKKFVVATTEPRKSHDNIEFVNGNIVKLITDLKEHDGKDIWLFGGAGITDAFIQADVVDEYIIGIIPIILGKGRKLFDNEYPTINLQLDECTVTDGITILRYTKRK